MGPLENIRIVEFAGLGPGPFAAMLLADLGATVLRIERPGENTNPDRAFDVVLRNRKAISLDLKKAKDNALALEIIGKSDGLIEGFRPGVMERLGLGPGICLARQPKLIYGRMTGWGQRGPLAERAGHDINYIALSGALDAIGRAGQPPTVPLNLIGDYGGGALYLALGMVSAMLEARVSGLGQIVDAAMIDGATSLMSKFFGHSAAGIASGRPPGPRGTNLLDSGAYFYDVYACADGQWLAVGAIEPQFHAELISRLGIDAATWPAQWDKSRWDECRARLAVRFSEQARSDWLRVFEGSDACVSPILSLSEAGAHPHMSARRVIVEVDGVPQPAPAPRFSGTPLSNPRPPTKPDANRTEVLAEWGLQDHQTAAAPSFQ